MGKVLITRSKLDGLATTIAAKSGATLPLTIAQMDAAVEGISSVDVEALSVTSNGTYTAPTGTAYSPVTVAVPTPTPSLQPKSATPTTSQQTVAPDSGYDGLSSVTVNPIPSQYVVPSGNKAITENGTGIDVSQYETVDVAVPSVGSWELLASQTLTNIARTSTSAATAGTIALGSSAFTATDMIWVHVRDTAGVRAGYFYGADSLFVNANKATGSTSTFSAPAIETIRCTTAGALAGYTGGYGVWGYSISSGGSLTIRMRYNSNYSLTIDGDYKVDVYKLTPPSGIELFPS